MLRQIDLDRVDTAPGPLGDPALGQIVLDVVEAAALVHGVMIDRRPDVRMSRSAHFRRDLSPVRESELSQTPV